MIPKRARLTYWDGPLPEVGHYLQTRSGTTYLIIGFTPNTRKDAKSVGRLDLLKYSEEDKQDIPADALIHSFKWN